MINQSKDNTKFSLKRAAEHVGDNKFENAQSSKNKDNKKIEMFYVTETFYKKEVVDDPLKDENPTPKIIKDKAMQREHGSQNYRCNLDPPKIEIQSLQFPNKKSLDYHNIKYVEPKRPAHVY